MGSISTVRIFKPIRCAESSASVFECAEEYLDGIETPCTFVAPIASAAIAATRAESMPPDSPRTTDLKPFLVT